VRPQSDEALSLTGKDVGTPIVHFGPPDGVVFFGPVISRMPDESQDAELWDPRGRRRRHPRPCYWAMSASLVLVL